jgi:phosphoesterase RecJ-like protein
MINFDILLGVINNNKSFVLTTHVNPDADAIGSETALFLLLKLLNKDVRVINYSSTPYNLNFLDGNNIIEKFDPSIHKDPILNCDVIIALDLNNPSRTVSMKDLISQSKAIKVCIDHHQSPVPFADHYFIDTEFAATGEIILDFMKKFFEQEISKEIAIRLYAAIMTDTGSFRFERTTPKLHRDIAYLIERGANPFEVYDKIFDRSKFSKIKLLARALNSIRILCQGKLSYMIITQEDFKLTQAEESDTENFVNYNLSIEGVVLGLLFIELPNGFKVSFRSKGHIRADLIAQKFGGGGHKNAAGARFYNQSMSKELIDNILNTSELYLNQLEFNNA